MSLSDLQKQHCGPLPGLAMVRPSAGKQRSASKKPTQLTTPSFGLHCVKQKLPSMHRYDSVSRKNRRTITSQQQRRQLYPASSPVLRSNSTQPTRRWRPENAHFYKKYYEVFPKMCDEEERFGCEPIKILCWKNNGRASGDSVLASISLLFWQEGGATTNNDTTNNNKDENNRNGQEVWCRLQVSVHIQYQNTTICLCFWCYIIIFFNNILDLLCL